MSLKIIFTVTNDLTYDRRMLRICQSLATKGYQVTLVGRQLKTSQVFHNQYFTHHRFSLIFNKGKFFYLEYNIRLFFWLLFQRFDRICGIDLDSILPCYFAAKIKGILRGASIPCVYDAHELFTEVPEVITRPKIRRIWLAVERFVATRLQYQYTVSQSIADEMRARYGATFGVIRNLPLRTEVQNKPITNGKRILIYIGNLNEGRGLETAIEALPYTQNIDLWIVGDGDLMPILRGMVEQLDLKNRVRFWGYIRPDGLNDILQQADIGLNILEAKGLSYEYSLANKFLDYIQARLPQICTQFIEYQRINAEYEVAVLLPKADVQSVVNAINQLNLEPLYYQKLKENCQLAAQKLCWEEEEKRLIEFYKNIV
jgi:glycosyltransferase involved in cell wall biosynthesis